jgi:hypothetical protein
VDALVPLLIVVIVVWFALYLIGQLPPDFLSAKGAGVIKVVIVILALIWLVCWFFGVWHAPFFPVRRP